MFFEIEKFNLEMLEDDRFSKLTMYIAHDGINNNRSNIDLSVLEEAANSVVNIPILAHIETEDNDFGEHEMEYDEETDKITYIEKPIGLIPSSNNDYHYEEINGKTYVVVSGYVWNIYSEDAANIINRDKDVKLSIEIEIDEKSYDKSSKILDIKKFRYTGITLLGKKYGTGMVNAHAVLETFSDKISELNNFIMKFSSNVSSDNQFNEHSNIHKYQKKEDDLVPKTKQDIAASFKLTANQLYEEIQRELSECKYITQNWYGETVERCTYYLNDYDESFVYYTDVKDECITKKAPYSMDGDNVMIDFSNSKRIKYSPVDWEEGTGVEEDSEGDVIGEFSSVLEKESVEFVKKLTKENENIVTKYTKEIAAKEEAIINMNKTIEEYETNFSATKENINELEAKVDSLTSEISKYKETEENEKIDELFVEYSSLISDEEKSTLLEKRSKFSSFSDFEREVKSFVCDRIIKKAKEKNMNFISMGINHEDYKEEKPKSHWDRLNEKY
ncbi:hypothetical protein [Paenibacillus spiritus]|nr:hypothetical protein [Paenibacillus spiritus]